MTKTLLLTIDSSVSKRRILEALKDKGILSTVFDAGDLKKYSCGFCKFEGVVSETSDYTRCPNCGGL